MADCALPVVLPARCSSGSGCRGCWSALVTLLQRSTPWPLQGRTFSASEFAFGAPQTLSIALGAALVALIDYRFILLVQASWWRRPGSTC